MTEFDEVKQVIVYKIPMFLLGTAIGLGVVWIALLIIPKVALNAVAELAP